MFYLDIPSIECVGDDDAGWTPVARFRDKSQAVEFIREHFGHCDDDGNICLLSQGDMELDEDVELSEHALDVM